MELVLDSKVHSCFCPLWILTYFVILKELSLNSWHSVLQQKSNWMPEDCCCKVRVIWVCREILADLSSPIWIFWLPLSKSVKQTLSSWRYERELKGSVKFNRIHNRCNASLLPQHSIPSNTCTLLVARPEPPYIFLLKGIPVLLSVIELKEVSLNGLDSGSELPLKKNPFRDFLCCHQMLSQKLLLENAFTVKLKYLYSLKKAATPTQRENFKMHFNAVHRHTIQ